jgi:hypothetical protein
MVASTTQQIAQGSVQAGGAIAAGLVPVAMIPIVGAAVAGVALALSLIFNRKGPQQKVASTQIVNDVEPLLRENVDAYLNGPRTASSQAYALASFDSAWAFVAGPEGCGNPALGTPGQRCISERQRGGSAPWCPTGTGCDWFTLYRDPIALDADVQPDPAAAGDPIAAIAAEFEEGDLLRYALPAAVVLVALSL